MKGLFVFSFEMEIILSMVIDQKRHAHDKGKLPSQLGKQKPRLTFKKGTKIRATCLANKTRQGNN